MSSKMKKSSLNRDQFLWYAMKNGDTRALEMIYNQHVDYLYNYGYKFSKDKDKTMDAIHDLFLELYKYRKKLSEDVNVKAYLTRSLRNIIYKNTGSRLMLVEESDTLMHLSSADLSVDSFEDELVLE